MEQYNDINDISYEELELIRNLSCMECVDDGVYPVLDFVIDSFEDDEKI